MMATLKRIDANLPMLAAILCMLGIVCWFVAGQKVLLQKNIDGLKSEITQTQKAVQQVQDDIRVIETLKDKDGADEAVRAAPYILKPVSRNRALRRVEGLAHTSGFKNFVINAEAATKASVSSKVGGAIELMKTPMKLSGEARSEIEVEDFLTRLKAILPGRARLLALDLQKNTQNPTINFVAGVEWLSNPFAQDDGGVP